LGVSQTNAAVLIVLVLMIFIGGVFLFAPQGIHDQKIIILLLASGFGITIFLWQRFVTGQTEWMIDKNEITISWEKKCSFTRGKEITMKWNEIKDIRKGLDPHYYNLKIILVTGQKFTFFHDYMQVKDDFEECLATLYRTFGEQHNDNSRRLNEQAKRS
jgi:hypothetical protein